MGQLKPPPGIHYEWAHPDPKHPSYVGNFLRPKTFDNGKVRAAYEVVQAPEADPWLSMLRRRDDQGGSVDTKAYNGDLILLQTTVKNAGLCDESIEDHNKQLDRTLRHNKSGKTFEGTRTGRKGSTPDAIDVAMGR